MIGQLVLKWDQASLPSRLSASQPFSSGASGEYLAAMHCLIKRIAQLQSAHEQPQGPITDPEILLPLVLQEAEAVFKSLDLADANPTDLNSSSNQPTAFSATVFSAAFGKHSVQPIKTLAPWLLWWIAQSTHETLQLLEGIPAQASADRQTWHPGIVRLVACLEIQSAQIALDLVTLQAAPSGLAEECFVQIQASLLGQQTTSVKALLQRLTPQLIATAPILESFLTGFPTDFLMPYQAWQAGQVCLRLRLEFVSTSLNPSAAASPDPLPTIKFTHPDWLERHITTVVEAQLTQVLLQQPESATQNGATEPEYLISIVRQGCVAIDELQRSLTLASRTFAQQVLPLDELALRLLWGMNRTAYGVMRWLSGVQVRLLQPQQGWTTGVLRFAVYLVIRTSEQTWRFDLVRRCFTSTDAIAENTISEDAIAENAIVESCDWGGLQLLSLSDLASEIWRQVSQTTPEILLLCTETEVNVTVGALPGQLGVLHLQTAFEFTASGDLSQS